jgi:RNA polymerase sigma-70 factor (ECF subfamily)
MILANPLPTDEHLWAEYVAGSQAAFRRLYAELAPRVHAFFMRSFRSPTVADDLMQQTFLQMVRARAQFRADSPLRPWLFAIAARVRLDELRRRMRQPQLDEDGLDPSGDVGEPVRETMDPAERADVRTRVQAAFDALPETQRVVVHLHRFEGLSFGEIAAILGTSEGAVRVRAFRAFETLRTRLAPLVEDAS